MRNKIGICVKCGEEKSVQKHHFKGYLGENADIVADYCHSCDEKAHIKARKEGRCNLTSKEVQKLSVNSCQRRIYKRMHFYQTLLPNVQLQEGLSYNINNGHVSYSAFFRADHKKELFYINEE